MENIKVKQFFQWFVILLICIFPINTLHAQQSYLPDVGGIVCGNVYTYSDVISKLGQPTSYWSGMSEDGLDEEYYFGTNMLRFSENGYFNEFVLEDNRFAIYASFLNGGIKVGDPVSKFQQLGFGSLTLNPDGRYSFDIGDFWFDIEHNNGIITMLLFTIPV